MPLTALKKSISISCFFKKGKKCLITNSGSQLTKYPTPFTLFLVFLGGHVNFNVNSWETAGDFKSSDLPTEFKDDFVCKINRQSLPGKAYRVRCF